MENKTKEINLKAFVLAAGFGSRLSPLTKEIPKPLLPFMNQLILFHTLDQIKSTGIKEVCVNTHFKSELIKKALEQYPKDHLSISVSDEKEILGTGGSLAAQKKWRNNADLLVINSDIIHTFNLNKIIEAHKTSSSEAIMLVTKEQIPGETILNCQNNKLISFSDKKDKDSTAHGFACIQILSNKVLNELPNKGSYSIIPSYIKLLSEGRPISTLTLFDYWADIGTPEKYLKTHLDFLALMKKKKNLNHPSFRNIPLSLKGLKNILFDLKEKTTLLDNLKIEI